MISSRYFFYLILLTMLSNVMVFVPHVLIYHRFDGTMMSVFLAVPIGMIFIFVFSRAISKFPGKTLPDIMEKSFPKWFRILYTLQLVLFWLWAGAQPLLAFSRITKGFLNPEMSLYLITFLYLLFVAYGASLKTNHVLFLMEVILVIIAPLILFILGRSVLEASFSWLTVRDMVTYVKNPPHFDALAAATYIFSGYTNMVIYNCIVPSRLKGLHIWAIGAFGLMILLTSFLIPIALLGRETVSDYVFPWISASDTLRLEFFFMERVMLLFIMLYLFIILIHSVVIWHVGLELSKSLLTKKYKYFKWILVGLFSAGTLVMRSFIPNDYLAFQLGAWFLDLRFLAEFVLLAILLIAARRNQTS